MEYILGTIQKRTDDLWQVCFSQTDKKIPGNPACENWTPKQVMFATDADVVLDEWVPREVTITKLVDAAAVYELIGAKSITSWIVHPFLN